MTVWEVTHQSPLRLSRRVLREVQVVVEGSRSSVLESQVTAEQKRENKKRLQRNCQRAAKQQFSHVSLIKLVDTLKEMADTGRTGKMRWRAVWGGCRAEGAAITVLTDVTTAEPSGDGEPTVMLTRTSFLCRDALTFTGHCYSILSVKTTKQKHNMQLLN